MTVRLTPAEYHATQAKLAKVNERAAKRGFTGRFQLTGERVEVTTNEFGLPVREIFYDAAITGEAPKYNGWTFLARVDRVDKTFTLATAPGVEHVDRALVRLGECDHCGQRRHRNNTYLVRSEDGEVKNVGSTCIKDFLGWEGKFAFFSTSETEGDLLGGGSGWGERAYSVDTILAVAHAATRAFGWVPSSQRDYAEPTADVVRKVLGIIRIDPRDRFGYDVVGQYADEAVERAATVRAFVLSDEFGGDSTYVDNLKAAIGAELVEAKQIGLLASAPQAYIRHLETDAERAAKQARWAAEKDARATSDYLGEVKDKVQFKGTISAIEWKPQKFGTTVLYTIVTPEGNVVKWWASHEFLGDQEGVEVSLQGTIKKLDEYHGTKATVVTYCKAIAGEKK
jgi:hypothetical protein